MTEHAAELAAEKEQPFQPIGGIHEEFSAAAVPDVAPGVPEKPVEKAVEKPAEKPHPAMGNKRESTLQKIARLDISGRIQLAMKGTKEERGLLIRVPEPNWSPWPYWNPRKSATARWKKLPVRRMFSRRCCAPFR